LKSWFPADSTYKMALGIVGSAEAIYLVLWFLILQPGH